MSEFNPENHPYVEQKVYSNGAEHLYAVDETGKHVHVAEKDVLKAYGYEMGPEGKYVSMDGGEAAHVEDTPATVDADQSLYDEYSAAVKDEDATIRIKNSDTGKMEATKVKDLNFREWLKATESRKAARWYSATRAHGEVPEGEIGDLGNGDDASALANREDAERINAQTGKSNPTEDDVAYYRWLKNAATSDISEDEDGTPNEPTEPTPNAPTPEEPTPTEPLPATPEFTEAQERLNAARDKLARIRAGREARTIHIRRNKFGKKALNEALAEYEEARIAAGARYLEILLADPEGRFNDGETLAAMANAVTLEESNALTQRQRELEIADTENKWLRGFYNFWARHSQAGRRLSKQGLKDMAWKTAALAPIGIAAGVVLAPAAAMAGAAAGGVAAATRVGRGLMGAKIGKEADARRVAEQKATRRLQDINEQIAAANADGWVISSDVLTGTHRRNTKETVRNNRRRAIIAGMAAAAIGGATSLALDHVGWDHFWHHGNNGSGNTDPNTHGSGSNTQPPSNGGNAQPASGGNVRPVGPNGQPLTDEQIRIFNSDEFKRMVAEGNKIHEQVNAEYPIQPNWFVNQAVQEAYRNGIADQRILQALEWAARQAQQTADSATGTAASTL